MNRTIDDLAAIATFVRIAELGGISPAARALGVPKSTISRRLVRLEQAMGITLVRRTSRQTKLTEEGERFLARVAPAILSLEDAARWLQDEVHHVSGSVRISAPHDFGIFIAEFLVDFGRRYPDIRVELELDNRFVDLVQEGFDMAIRAGALSDSSLIARHVANGHLWLAASPAYLDLHGRPRRIDKLAKMNCILFRPKGTSVRWRLMGAREPRTVDVRGSVATNDFGLVWRLARAGAGVALMPAPLVRRSIADGTLERVLPPLYLDSAPVHLVFPSNRHLPHRVALLRDELAPMLRHCFAPGEE